MRKPNAAGGAARPLNSPNTIPSTYNTHDGDKAFIINSHHHWRLVVKALLSHRRPCHCRDKTEKPDSQCHVLDIAM